MGKEENGIEDNRVILEVIGKNERNGGRGLGERQGRVGKDIIKGK